MMFIMNEMILGFDFGMKFIGVAVGQTLTHSATPLTTLLARDGIPQWPEITTLIQTWQPTRFIVGIPLHMDGTIQPLTFCARKFATRLHTRFALPVSEVDERLTTWEAKHLHKTHGHKLSQKEILQINATSAALLLEQWLTDQLIP
jgi:putative Holliday junction resolvase